MLSDYVLRDKGVYDYVLGLKRLNILEMVYITGIFIRHN